MGPRHIATTPSTSAAAAAALAAALVVCFAAGAYAAVCVEPSQVNTCIYQKSTGCVGTCGTSDKYSVPTTTPDISSVKCSSNVSIAPSTNSFCTIPSVQTVADCCKRCFSRTWCSSYLYGTSSQWCYLYKSGSFPTCQSSGTAGTFAKKCANAINDPHFRGGHGTMFEFNGLPEQNFCLLTDRELQVNMRMRGYFDDRTVGASVLRDGKAVRTWIRELGVLWVDRTTGAKHSLRMAARDGKSMERGEGFVKEIEVDGKPLPRMQIGDSYFGPGGLNLSFVAYEKDGGGFFDVDSYTLEIAGLLSAGIRLRPAHPLLQTPDDAQTHINVHFNSISRTNDVHGILGQTYRQGREQRAIDYSSFSLLLHRPFAADGFEGKGFLDGKTNDYLVSDVMAADCLYTAFDGRELPAINEANGML